MLGLPDHIRAGLFDLDGVLTRTATVHAAAWKEMFDDFLEHWARRSGDPFVAFDLDTDYVNYVDGRPRVDGVREFLNARGIHLPDGWPDDPPGGLTVHALANRKNLLLLTKIEQDGVDVFEGSVRYLEELARAGVPRAVVSSSANCAEVVHAAGLDHLLPARIDGLVALDRGLAGKPAPDTFLAAAEALGVPPGAAAVFEDAVAGVQAGHTGRFGCVVGVDRLGPGHGHGEALRRAGADLVVTDLADLLGGLPAGAGAAGRSAG